MYTEYFGLTERPFSLAPDPRFLFMSASHREALAHMLYGIEQGDGFIEVFGQVGTGKTTLCRTLLERIGDDADIAYIFNPSPSEIELLTSINREFALPTAARSRTELIEELNRFLIARKAAGRRVLLVIDEAQNLDPAVLEQVRLLSNLETDREKLIQIVLIGQPELEENLSRTDLRQLRQRITVRWNLQPFSRDEVGEYLIHRLRVAGRADPDLFEPAAVRVLYRASEGVPRIINAIADRALLSAYSEGKKTIDAATVKRAASEVPVTASAWRAESGMGWPLAAGLVAAGLVAGLVASALPTGGEAGGVGAIPIGDVAALERDLGQLPPDASSAAALDALLETWGHDEVIGATLAPNLYPEAVRNFSSLRVLRTRSTRVGLELLDLPAVLELDVPEHGRRYVAVLALEPTGAVRLGAGDARFDLVANDLERLWTGRAFYLWNNFESLPAMRLGMTGSAVRWAQSRLTDLGYMSPGDPSGSYDLATREAVKRFQTGFGLDESGDIDPQTLIALYQALDYETPRLGVAEESS